MNNLPWSKFERTGFQAFFFFFFEGLFFFLFVLFGFLADFFYLFLCGRERREFNKGLAQPILVPADTYLFAYLQSGQSETISRCN